jgi:hypothetical protein
MACLCGNSGGPLPRLKVVMGDTSSLYAPSPNNVDMMTDMIFPIEKKYFFVVVELVDHGWSVLCPMLFGDENAR